MARVKKARIGRPPRTDDPTPIRVLLPGALRRWLKVHAAKVGRDQGDVITDALLLYRARRTMGGTR